MAARWAETPAETVSLRDATDLGRVLSAYAELNAPESLEPEFTVSPVFPGTIQSLVTAYGASGHEGKVREKVKELLPEWARNQTKTDSAGNLILHVGDGQAGNKAPRIAFVAHMDELGYEVKKIEEDGRLLLEVLGGGYTQYFLGHTALVHKVDGTFTGAVMELPAGWEKPGFEWPQDLRSMDDSVHAYVGTSSREATQKTGHKTR